MIDKGGNNKLNANFEFFFQFCAVFLSCKILFNRAEPYQIHVR